LHDRWKPEVGLGRWLRGWLSARRHPEQRHLVVVLLVIAACWGFVELAGEMVEGSTQPFDEGVLRALRRPDDPATPRGPGWLVQTGRDLTALGGSTVLLLVIAATAGYLALGRHFRTMGLVLVSGLGGMLVNLALKYVLARERPTLVPHLMEVSTPSFPSGHAMLSAAVYLSLGLLVARIHPRRREKAYIMGVAILATVLVGLTRVYLGVHYPTDVMAGWLAGAAWALACGLVVQLLEKKGALPRPRPAL
jgi:undecaprenyl-diphosphatase